MVGRGGVLLGGWVLRLRGEGGVEGEVERAEDGIGKVKVGVEVEKKKVDGGLRGVRCE